MYTNVKKLNNFSSQQLTEWIWQPLPPPDNLFEIDEQIDVFRREFVEIYFQTCWHGKDSKKLLFRQMGNFYNAFMCENSRQQVISSISIIETIFVYKRFI
jgi:hypothetical protein